MTSEYIFGIHPILELIKAHPHTIQNLWIQSGLINPRLNKIINLSEKQPFVVRLISKKALEQLIGHDKHQGVIAEVNGSATQNFSISELIQKDKHPLFLILDGLQDPHNLGACIRTANAFGVTAVIMPKDRSAPLNATARKVAAGAAEYTPCLSVTNLSRSIRELKEQGLWIVGTDLKANQSLVEIDANMPLALVMGSEEKGLRHLTKEHCDFLVNIPMYGEIQSLNVSVATGVCLYEIQRQRRLA